MKELIIVAINKKELDRKFFESYKKETIEEIILLGGTEEDIQLLKDEMIINGIHNEWSPKTVAWSIMQ